MGYIGPLDECRLGSVVTQFGNKKHHQGVRYLFNRTIMIHGVNTTGFSIGEMELAEAALSFQRIVTLPVEKRSHIF
jgi:hypothetical protein